VFDAYENLSVCVKRTPAVAPDPLTTNPCVVPEIPTPVLLAIAKSPCPDTVLALAKEYLSIAAVPPKSFDSNVLPLQL